MRRETKNLPKNEISAVTRINLESCQSNKTCYSKPTKTRKNIEIFREHMIENLYLDLTEETSDLKIYGKLFQGYKNVFIDKVIRFSVLFAKQIKLIMVILYRRLHRDDLKCQMSLQTM